ncbi:DUF222 domain-containing protein [Nannocystaceae bacterium ST9]
MVDCLESIEHLARQIAELARSVDTIKHAWLGRIREFDACNGWADTGCVSMVAWLAWWTGTSNKTASEHVRIARALGELPLIDRAFAAGELTYSKVRALTRAATPATQQTLIDVAKTATASQLDKIVAGLRRVRAHANPELSGGEPPRRFARFTETPEGMVRIVAQVGPEDALVLRAAMDLAQSPAGDSTSPRAANDPQSPAGDYGSDQADALVAVARGYLERKPTTRGTGCELIMMTTPEQLAHGPEGIGGFLRDGTPLPLHVARMLACDAARIDVSVGDSGEILDVGRSRRTIPTAIGRALTLRDGGCRVPGCGRSRHLQAHHVEAWAEGGETSISNLVLLCPGHHCLVHEGKLHVEIRAGQLEFINAHGLTLAPTPHHCIDPEVVTAWLDAAESSSEPPIAWDGSRLDLHEVIGWMMLSEGFRADLSARDDCAGLISG